MGQRIKARRDTSANWATSNPVLQLGELGFDTTNKRIKIGDGVTVWAALLYLSNGISAALNIGLNATYSVAHGLGRSPSSMNICLLCGIPNNGYSSGDRAGMVANNITGFYNANNYGYQTASALPTIIPRSGGAPVAISASQWQVLIEVNF